MRTQFPALRFVRIAVMAALAPFVIGATIAPPMLPLPERVTFQSADGATTLFGYLFKPEGSFNSRTPAVVMMHGRAGPYSTLAHGNYGAATLSRRHQEWGHLWAQQGYAALLVDSFGPRGYPQGFPRFSYDQRPASTIRLLQSIEAFYPMLALIHVFLDNARYHHAKLVQEWLALPGRRIKLHFIPTYCPHLNPIERLWGVMHRNVTYNKCYATCTQFADATLSFLREKVPRNWADLCDSVTDNFRVINPKDFRVVT